MRRAARRPGPGARLLSPRLTPARVVAASGAAVVVGMVAVLTVAPAADFSVRAPEALAELYARERDAILAALYLSGLTWCAAFLVFVAALYRELRIPPDETTGLLAVIGFTGGLANAAAIGVYDLLAALPAFRAPADAPLLPLLADAAALANAFTGFATAVCTSGFSLALRRIGFPAWLVALGAAVALHHLASAAALAPAGAWSPSGALSASAPLGMTLWVGCVAALTWRRRHRL